MAVIFDKNSTARISPSSWASHAGRATVVVDSDGTQLGPARQRPCRAARCCPLRRCHRLANLRPRAAGRHGVGHRRCRDQRALDEFHPCQVLANLQTIVENTRGSATSAGCPRRRRRQQHGTRCCSAGPAGIHASPSRLQGTCPDPSVRAAAAPRGYRRLGDCDRRRPRGRAGMADSDAIVLHCLPAHRGDEVTDAVMDGQPAVGRGRSQHAQKALLGNGWSARERAKRPRPLRAGSPQTAPAARRASWRSGVVQVRSQNELAVLLAPGASESATLSRSGRAPARWYAARTAPASTWCPGRQPGTASRAARRMARLLGELLVSTTATSRSVAHRRAQHALPTKPTAPSEPRGLPAQVVGTIASRAATLSWWPASRSDQRFNGGMFENAGRESCQSASSWPYSGPVWTPRWRSAG